ncbi:MAG: 50S ribosomal protein L24e [Candidatus Aenigmatarchaeota archaeon]
MKCSFCGNDIIAGTGKTIVRKDGSLSNFCNTKCERNFNMRDPVNVKWTNAAKKASNKE